MSDGGYRGKYCIVTGGNNGIGFEIVKSLAQQGAANVVIACRSVEKGQATAKAILDEIKSSSETKVEAMKLDLSSLKSVEDFAKEYLAKKYPLHFLFNNAGVTHELVPMTPTADGFDPVWQTNFLGHFLLTSLLFPVLKESAPARIVQTSSVMHELASSKIDFKVTAKTAKKSRYGASKLAMILFSYEFQRRFKDSGVQSIVIHPGGVDTGILDWLPYQKLARIFTKLYLLRPEQAANVALIAGLTLKDNTKGKLLYMTPYRQLISGSLLNNDALNVILCSRPGGYITQSSPLSKKESLAKDCWQVAEENLGRPFAA
jgi:NAD(P)-dependent dehydrogenase (short-subunit alcohol dehydrogenase family)